MSSHGACPKDWKEAHRQRAFELKEHGWSQARIAEAFGVSRAAVSQWLADPHGPDPWRAKARLTGPTKLTREQLLLLPTLLAHGAELYGFHGDLWTCARVTTVIRQYFGVTYHKAHVALIL